MNITVEKTNMVQKKPESLKLRIKKRKRNKDVVKDYEIDEYEEEKSNGIN